MLLERLLGMIKHPCTSQCEAFQMMVIQLGKAFLTLNRCHSDKSYVQILNILDPCNLRRSEIEQNWF